ncbi:hypothetical protein J6590_022911 [Homalodisca vitripennis]|nr:hypothetical protein J6590_022911 [Homalodisca vitripennis]
MKPPVSRTLRVKECEKVDTIMTQAEINMSWHRFNGNSLLLYSSRGAIPLSQLPNTICLVKMRKSVRLIVEGHDLSKLMFRVFHSYLELKATLVMHGLAYTELWWF